MPAGALDPGHCQSTSQPSLPPNGRQTLDHFYVYKPPPIPAIDTFIALNFSIGVDISIC